MSGKHAGGSRTWLPPALLAVVALVAATVLWSQGASGQPTRSPSTAGSTSAGVATTDATPTPDSSSAAPTPSASTAAPRTSPLPAAGAPRRVVVPSLGIDATVVPIATEGTALDPPADPQVLGWWSGGAPAGAARGTALVTGHTVNAGGGAMDDLEQIEKGEEIRVTTPRGVIRYVTESVQVLDKDTIARQAQQLFDQRVAGRLVLVTCEDWDGTGYRSNVVVTAVPA